MKKTIAFCGLLLVTTMTWAAEDDLIETPKQATTAENLIVESSAGKKCDFTINCKAGGKEFAFQYVTKGNVCNQSNPGSLFLLTKKQKQSLGIKGITLKKAEDFGNAKPICEVAGRKYPAKLIDNQRLILFLRTESQPGYDKLGAVLIDLKKNKVLTFTSNIGAIKNTNLALMNTSGGVKTRLVKESIKGVRCDCDAAYADAWKSISVQKNIFKVKWIDSKN